MNKTKTGPIWSFPPNKKTAKKRKCGMQPLVVTVRQGRSTGSGRAHVSRLERDFTEGSPVMVTSEQRPEGSVEGALRLLEEEHAH